MKIHDAIPYEAYSELSTNDICEQVETIIKKAL